MPERHRQFGIIVAKRRLASRWAEYVWQPYAVLPAVPAAVAHTLLGKSGNDEFFYAGALQLTLHSGVTGHYRDNLTSAAPSLWVFLHSAADGGYELQSVTADPYEGEALTESISGIVEAVPMPEEIQAWVADFVEAFHVVRPFYKRRRDNALQQRESH